MRRYYWYCDCCRQRGNRLYRERRDAARRVEIHRNKCPQPREAKVRSTKSAYLPIHLPYGGLPVKYEDFKVSAE